MIRVTDVPTERLKKLRDLFGSAPADQLGVVENGLLVGVLQELIDRRGTEKPPAGEPKDAVVISAERARAAMALFVETVGNGCGDLDRQIRRVARYLERGLPLLDATITLLNAQTATRRRKMQDAEEPMARRDRSGG
ncbi:MAG: hypothetical protein JXB46_00585 [Candidatus Eisenbacteria bacterium]|nr:hypothetical protein [Candidatus Eisenbacteria bacterium]